MCIKGVERDGGNGSKIVGRKVRGIIYEIQCHILDGVVGGAGDIFHNFYSLFILILNFSIRFIRIFLQ